MTLPTKKILKREVLWLLGILAAALPLAAGLHALTDQVPALHTALRAVLKQSGHATVLHYVLVVLAGYAGRLGAAAASHLTTATPLA
jgi:hypothetical protein